jgi:hypothetical protein
MSLALVIRHDQITGVVVIAGYAADNQPRGLAAADEVFS